MLEKKYLGKYLDFASRGIVLAALFVSMIIIIAVFQNLPYIGDNLIDTQLGYDHAKVMALMESYGADGRLFYAFASPTLDTLFPLVFTTLYAGAICAQRDFCRQWKNQTEITVKGSHFIQEDSPDEIGQAISAWLKNQRRIFS